MALNIKDRISRRKVGCKNKKSSLKLMIFQYSVGRHEILLETKEQARKAFAELRGVQ